MCRYCGTKKVNSRAVEVTYAKVCYVDKEWDFLYIIQQNNSEL